MAWVIRAAKLIKCAVHLMNLSLSPSRLVVLSWSYVIFIFVTPFHMKIIAFFTGWSYPRYQLGIQQCKYPFPRENQSGEEENGLEMEWMMSMMVMMMIVCSSRQWWWWWRWNSLRHKYVQYTCIMHTLRRKKSYWIVFVWTIRFLFSLTLLSPFTIIFCDNNALFCCVCGVMSLHYIIPERELAWVEKKVCFFDVVKKSCIISQCWWSLKEGK